MNTETQPTSAAELLAEWKGIKADWSWQNQSDDILKYWNDRIALIAARLDEMCEDLDIIDGENFFHAQMHPVQVSSKAQRMQNMIALLQWLLIKSQQ
jgi:hypothetical protein